MGTPPCVLLTEEVWGSPLHVMRSLGRAGVPVHTATVGSGRAILGRSRWSTSAIDLTSADGDDIVERLLELLTVVAPDGPAVVMPFSDRLVEVLHQRRHRFELRHRLLVPEPAVAERLLDKTASLVEAESAGLNVPPWSVVHTSSDLVEAGRLRFPLAIRPTAWSTGGDHPFKVRRVDDAQARDDVLRRGLDDGATLVVQEFVEGPDEAVEMAIAWRSADRTRTAICTGRKRRQSAADGGVMVWGQAEPLPDVAEACQVFLESTGLTGLGGVEFKRSQGKLWFIEANPRIEAIHFLATKAGIDTATLAYRDALGEAIPPVTAQGEAAAWVGSAWLEMVRSNPTGWRRALADRVAFNRSPSRVRAVASWRDPRPGVAFTGRILARGLAR